MTADYDPSPEVLDAAQAAIVRDFGRVIGTGQARNIAYIALVAARVAMFRKRETEVSQTAGTVLPDDMLFTRRNHQE